MNNQILSLISKAAINYLH